MSVVAADNELMPRSSRHTLWVVETECVEGDHVAVQGMGMTTTSALSSASRVTTSW